MPIIPHGLNWDYSGEIRDLCLKQGQGLSIWTALPYPRICWVSPLFTRYAPLWPRANLFPAPGIQAKDLGIGFSKRSLVLMTEVLLNQSASSIWISFLVPCLWILPSNLSLRDIFYIICSYHSLTSSMCYQRTHALYIILIWQIDFI